MFTVKIFNQGHYEEYAAAAILKTLDSDSIFYNN